MIKLNIFAKQALIDKREIDKYFLSVEDESLCLAYKTLHAETHLLLKI